MEGPKKISKSTRAGLQFPVGRIHSKFKANVQERVGETGTVFLAGVLEYLVAELLELAGNSAAQNKRKRVSPRDVMLAVRNDAEFTQIAGHIAGGGSLPHIEQALVPAPKKTKAAKNKETVV